jgi:hypothetical protein
MLKFGGSSCLIGDQKRKKEQSFIIISLSNRKRLHRKTTPTNWYFLPVMDLAYMRPEKVVNKQSTTSSRNTQPGHYVAAIARVEHHGEEPTRPCLFSLHRSEQFTNDGPFQQGRDEAPRPPITAP